MITQFLSNISAFGTTKSPVQRFGPHLSITPQMRNALVELLSKTPELYQQEMGIFLYRKFGVLVSTSTIGKALKSMRWSKKVNRRRAKEQKCRLARLSLFSFHF